MTLRPEHIEEALNKKTFDEIDPDEVLKHYGYKPEEVHCNGVGIGVWRKEEAFQKLGDIGASNANIQWTDAGTFFCTAYCTEQYPHICGEGHGVTASGQPIQAGVTVAADTSIFPYGTVLYIEDVGIRIVQDKGSAIQGKHLDVAVDTHENAKKWSGCGNHRVWILKEE